MIFRFRKWHLLAAIVLLLVEIYIALYVRDRFVRPYLGDAFATMLVYFGARSLISTRRWIMGVLALAIGCGIELLQYANLLTILGWQQSRLARTLLGSSFEWGDILAYTIGVLLAVEIDRALSARRGIES